MNNLYKNINYLSNNKFIISTYIREYDIRKANISILYNKEILTKDQYKYYYNMDKNNREINIGKMIINNKSISNILAKGIEEYRYKFLNDNNIDEYNVLAIKNDAIYIINQIPNITRFDNIIEFVNKNIYTSYYYINMKYNNLELYYKSPDMNIDNEVLHIKGINDDIINKYHKNYFYDFLCELFYCAENDNISEVISLLQSFYNQYVNLELDIYYYRNFNSLSNYSTILNTKTSNYYFNDNYIENSMRYKKILNISYNLNILKILYSYYSSLAFK